MIIMEKHYSIVRFYLYQNIHNNKFYISPKSPMECPSYMDPNLILNIEQKCEITESCILHRKVYGCGRLGTVMLFDHVNGWIHDFSDVLWHYE